MRVLLTGTSNSILIGGLRTAFENSAEISRFSNYSYGASGTVALGDHLSKIDFSQYDFCVLDYCVNEEILIYMEQSTTELAMNSFLCAIDAMSRAGCQPIILVLPSRTRMGFARPFEVAIKKVFGAKCVPIFNFYDLADRMVGAGQIEFSELFIDVMQLHPKLAQFVGQNIIEYMRKIAPTLMFASPVDVGHKYSALDFVAARSVNITGTSSLATRSTRWLSSEVLRIEEGAEISFNVAESSEVIGIAFNAARSIGDIIEASTDKLLFRLALNKLYTNLRELTAKALPVLNMMSIGPHACKLRYEFDEKLDSNLPPAAFELIGFICKRNELSSEAKVLVRDHHPRNLADEISDAEIETLIASLKIQDSKSV